MHSYKTPLAITTLHVYNNKILIYDITVQLHHKHSVIHSLCTYGNCNMTHVNQRWLTVTANGMKGENPHNREWRMITTIKHMEK